MVTIAASSDPLAGQKFGHYKLLQKIGAGGMGEVYRARDEHLDREVAVKVLRPGTLAGQHSRKLFRKEALALSKLNHPNIATIHDFDEQQGIDFLVMEYIPGITLSEKIARRPLPEKEAVALGIQLAEGLAAAHERGVIHRDLKPGNVMLTSDGRLKLLDFGLAKLRPAMITDATTETLVSGQVMAGTLLYMAPEQVLCGEIDARTDIYGAGVVLYEMTTGCRPYPDLDEAQTIAAILHKGPQAPSTLNPALSPELERIITKCLEKDPESRYQSAKELTVDLRRIALASRAMHASSPATHSFWKWKVIAAAFVVAAALITGGLLFRSRQARPLTETDTIVLADFVNNTGDPVFDDALKQALTVQLEQSPFLSILPEKKIRDTLRLMAHVPDDRVTPELGRDLCQRAGAKAVLWGSIAPLGTQYVVGLTAAECASGNHLASAQLQAARKEDVLKALGSAASSLRSKLGESLSSVQKFDAPIEEATTSSLEALKAFSLAKKAATQSELAAIPLYERALELDTNFADAYAALGAAQGNLEQVNLARVSLRKAFDLRDRVSERERFHIAGLYYNRGSGETERAKVTYRQWAQSYPRDGVPHHNLGAILMEFGAWEESAAESREAVRLMPDSSGSYTNLAIDALAMNRPEMADSVLNEARAKNANGSWLALAIYSGAFFRGDTAEMEHALATADTGEQPMLLSLQSDTEAFYGRLERARQFTRRAADSDLLAGSREGAALWQANSALREAEFGNRAFARREIKAALSPAPAWRVKVLSALTLARLGEVQAARVIVKELETNYPVDTRINVYWIPTIRAAADISEGNARRAIDGLEATAPYELGGITPLAVGSLYPAYLRGQAYLMTHDGPAAAAEFQKFLDHRGIVLNFPLGALAHLQLGRAYVISGDTTKAKAAYQDFLELWKNADPEIPILKEAKAEYAKLH